MIFIPPSWYEDHQHEGVTRFEVIDHRATGKGRVLVAGNVTVSSDLQDAGRTLKVFLTDRVDRS